MHEEVLLQVDLGVVKVVDMSLRLSYQHFCYSLGPLGLVGLYLTWVSIPCLDLEAFVENVLATFVDAYQDEHSR